MADHLFETQTITSEGLNLIAHATAADAIFYTKALSNATVPADPSNVSSYSGKVGTIASSSSSGNAARITLAFENSDKWGRRYRGLLFVWGKFYNPSFIHRCALCDSVCGQPCNVSRFRFYHQCGGVRSCKSVRPFSIREYPQGRKF